MEWRHSYSIVLECSGTGDGCRDTGRFGACGRSSPQAQKPVELAAADAVLQHLISKTKTDEKSVFFVYFDFLRILRERSFIADIFFIY